MKPSTLFGAVLFLVAAAFPGGAQTIKPVPTLQYAQAENMRAPFSILQADGTVGGLAKDSLDLILTKGLGLPYRIIVVPSLRAQNGAEKGTIDLILTLKTPERLAWSVASDKPLYSTFFKIFTRRDHPRLAEILTIKTYEDIKALGLVTVSNLGNNWHKTNIEDRGIATEWVKNDHSLVLFLASGRADIAVVSPLKMNPLIRKEGLEKQLFETGVEFDEVWFHVLMSKKSPFLNLWPQINQKVTDVVATTEYKRLLDKAFEPYR